MTEPPSPLHYIYSISTNLSGPRGQDVKSSFAFIVYSIQNAPGRILHFKSFLNYEFNHSLNKDFNSLD